jgi:hypothetical protein
MQKLLFGPSKQDYPSGVFLGGLGLGQHRVPFLKDDVFLDQHFHTGL